MRWLGVLSTLLLLQVAFLGIFLAATGRLPIRELRLAWNAVWDGKGESETTGGGAPAEAVPPKEPSYADVLQDRALRSRLIEDKIKELESLRRVVATESSDVEDKQKKLVKIRAAVEKGLEEKNAQVIQEGKEKRLALLRAMPAKLAKSYLLDQAGDDEPAVIEMLKAMDDVVAAKIFKEFKLPQEVEKLNGWLEMLGRGEPEISRINDLRDQMPARN